MLLPANAIPTRQPNEARAKLTSVLPLDQLTAAGEGLDEMKGFMAESPDGAWRYYPFLARVSAVLASSLDLGRTLRRAVHLPLPDLGIWCALHLNDHDGTLHYTQAAHVDPAVEAVASAFWQEAFACDPEVRMRLSRVVRTGEPEVVAATALTSHERSARTSPLVALLSLLDLRSLLAVPLRLRGHAVGVIVFGSPAPRAYRARQIVAAARVYASHVAVALDHARTYTQSREALNARSMLVASSVHDLRNPLTVIKARAQTLQRSFSRSNAGLEASRARILDEGLEAIDVAATGITQIVDDLLELIHDERGDMPALRHRRYDLVALTQRLVTTYQQMAPGHEIVVSAPGMERLDGEFDSGKIARALGNLLDNAIKYSPAGSRISVELARGEHLDREPGQTTEWAVVRVRDHGIGIPEADLAAIFRPFVRGENVQTRIPGSGVGLSGVRQIIEQHGGTISVESALGRGSAFTIHLPLNSPWHSAGTSILGTLARAQAARRRGRE